MSQSGAARAGHHVKVTVRAYFPAKSTRRNGPCGNGSAMWRIETTGYTVGFEEATYMHCLGGVRLLLLFQVS